MLQRSTIFKASYCLSLLSTMIPIGIGIKNNTIGILLWLDMDIICPLIIIAICIYRAYLIIKISDIMQPLQSSKFSKILRFIGISLIYTGAVVGFVDWVTVEPLRIINPKYFGDDSLFSVVSSYLMEIGRMGIGGVIIFEFTRLSAYEHLRSNEKSKADAI